MAAAQNTHNGNVSAGDMDDRVFRYFQRPPEGVKLPTDGLSSARRKRLSHCLVAMYDDDHWKNKRGHVPRAPDPVHMDKPFDAARFNFNKADSRETIMSISLCESLHPVLVNVSPLMIGHTVVPLWAEQQLPQGALGKLGVQCMIELAASSHRSHYRVGYNSLGAYASVNHLHVHGMYAAALDGKMSTVGFPIEEASHNFFMIAAGGAKVSTLNLDVASGHIVNGLIFEGTPQELTESVGSCVELLATMRLPHNLLVRMKPSPACFLIPRQPQECFDVAEVGCNAAICELCGFLVMQSEATYEKLSLQSVRSSFWEGASLSQSEFDALLARCGQVLSPVMIDFGPRILDEAPPNSYTIGECVEVRDTSTEDWKQRVVTRVNPLLAGGLKWKYVRKIDKESLQDLPVKVGELTVLKPPEEMAPLGSQELRKNVSGVEKGGVAARNGTLVSTSDVSRPSIIIVVGLSVLALGACVMLRRRVRA